MNLEKCFENTTILYNNLIERKNELEEKIKYFKSIKVSSSKDKIDNIEDLKNFRENQDESIKTFRENAQTIKMYETYLDENNQKIYHLLNPSLFITQTEKARINVEMIKRINESD